MIMTNFPFRVFSIINPEKPGKFRFVSKTRGGGYGIVDVSSWQNERFHNDPDFLLSYFKKGALQTIEYKAPGSDTWLGVFSRSGKKIIYIDEFILNSLTVGTINSYWLNTGLYSQDQYKANGAKTWADLAYGPNKVSEETELVNQ